MKFKLIFYNTAELSLKDIKNFVNQNPNFKVQSLTALYLGDKYSDFISDIYKEGWIPQEDLELKQNFVKQNGRHLNAYIFEVEAKTVTEEYHPRKERKVYVEIEDLKKSIRQSFKSRVPNYFHDILVHSPDCDAENKYINNLIEEYKKTTPYKTKEFVALNENDLIR